MSDPYNSYGSSVPPVPEAAPPPAASPGPGQQRDRISRLAVSESWKRKFRLIEKAGGPSLPHLRSLTLWERIVAQVNFLAVLFGPVYYLIKGMWRMAVLYLVVALVAVVLLELAGLGKLVRAVGTGISVAFAMRANIAYYKEVVLGKAVWF